MSPARALFLTRLLHTVIWAVMAAAIVALPFFAATRRFEWAWAVTLLIALEGIALGLCGGACPLTAVARRYTNEESPTFDIFLPVFIAKWNKQIFGALFVVGEVLVVRSLLVVNRASGLHYLAAICFGCAATALAFAWYASRALERRKARAIAAAVATGFLAAGLALMKST